MGNSLVGAIANLSPCNVGQHETELLTALPTLHLTLYIVYRTMSQLISHLQWMPTHNVM